MDWASLQTILETAVENEFTEVILSNPRQKEQINKVKIRPVKLKDEIFFQSTEFREKKVFHNNLTKDALKEYLDYHFKTNFKQGQIATRQFITTVLISKKGSITVKTKNVDPVVCEKNNSLEHNRTKQYILKEGRKIPFLEDLGVMTYEGKVVAAKYDKFRQINRFLEFIEDVLPKLDKDRELTIIDFGCGKSYLTFGMYYYLKELKGYDVNIIGLDLKQDVIDHCNRLRDRYGFLKLHFCYGDIGSYEGVSQVDMVVTLHACDTATDYALAKAVKWGAKVILSVPCCQHELNKQIESEELEPILQYGLIKERVAALYTDAIRAQLLESVGYRTQILEFIDMEHTPKNIMIRALWQGTKKDNALKLESIMNSFHIQPTLAKLLQTSRE